MAYVRQYDKDHVRQRLYVHWDVSTQCNFKCTYCYAMRDYGDEWGKIDDWSKQKIVIKALSRSTLPVFLGLLGGEPTSHPHYHEMVQLCHDAVCHKEQGRLYVTTNGSKPAEFFKKHPYYDNMYFLFSFHPEYEGKYGKDFKILKDNIQIALDKGFRCKVNLMLHNDPKFWKKTHNFADFIESLDNLEIHPHFLYKDGDAHKLTDYNDAFYKEFDRFKTYRKYFTFETDTGDKDVYNDYTLFRNTLTGFKGWDCWNNNYEITYKGVVHRVCFDDRVDLLKNIFFFRDIKRVCPVTCPHTHCNCDGLLKIYKENV